jgi:hypothetical protein
MEVGDRKTLLERLVAYQLPIEPVLEGLSHFPFDSDQELVCIHRDDVVSIIDRFIAGKLTAEQVTDWADQVEVRDDLGLEDNHREMLRDAIFRLANPNLRDPITFDAVRAIRSKIVGG